MVLKVRERHCRYGVLALTIGTLDVSAFNYLDESIELAGLSCATYAHNLSMC